MEQKIREYEKMIAEATNTKMNMAERVRLAELHSEVVANFQHERLIHLIVTLFFAFFGIEFILITMWTLVQYGLSLDFLPLYLITLILVVLTFFYVKHYYFLENHIQNLYKYTKKLRSSQSK